MTNKNNIFPFLIFFLGQLFFLIKLKRHENWRNG